MLGVDIADIFKQALPEAALWGRIAISTGAAGLFVSLLLVLFHLRDQRSLRRGERNPAYYRPPRLGPLNQSLGEFFRDPIHNAPLSPDAAAEYVIGRLEAHRETTQSVLRYFSYAPLLFGLMGTILALRSLLVLSGNTLQQIQPHLAGVFAGTLAGIAGSLLAAVGSLVLDATALSTVNRAQDFIHRHILPLLPERRIALRIEEAVLALLTERIRLVVDNFNHAVEPVARQMQQIAERCGTAAENATKAFSEAARVVREAGDWEVASRNFKSGAHMIDSSAEQLSDATKQTAEVILRLGEVRQSYAELVTRIDQSAQSLNATNLRLEEQFKGHLATLGAQTEALSNSIGVLNSATNTLGAELVRRAASDSVHIDLIKLHTERTSNALTTLADLSRESSNALAVLPTQLETVGGTVSEGLEKGVALGMEHIGEHFAGQFQEVAATMKRISEVLSASATESTIARDGQLTVSSADHNAHVHDAVTELRRAAEHLQGVAESFKRAQPAVEIPAKKDNGFLRRLFGG